MTLGVGQSMGLLIMSLLAIGILLRILAIVHHQSRRFKELETRLGQIEKQDKHEKVLSSEMNTEGEER